MNELLIFVGGVAAGVVVGGVVAWFATRGRTLAQAAGERAKLELQAANERVELEARGADERVKLEGRAATAEATLTELRTQVSQGEQQTADLRSELAVEQQARVAADTRCTEALKNIDEQKRLLDDASKKFKDAFTALSTEALRKNSEAFAEKTLEKVRPLREALLRYEKQIDEMEKARQKNYGGVNQQLQALDSANQQLLKTTTGLENALRKPDVKGRWGELQLKRVVEAAGMSAQCDFVEQLSVDTDEGRQRPDLVVKLPGDRIIVVDSKVSTDAYLDAVAAEDESQRKAHLERYAKAIRTHVQQLSKKAYWDQFERSPDYVVMFVAGESFFSAALEQDRGLIEDAMRKKIIVASPTTLIALLGSVAHCWRQQTQLDHAKEIAQTTKDLFDRVCKFAEHLDRIGDNLRRATEAYNASVGSWERRVLPMSRRIAELSAYSEDGETGELTAIDVTTRSLPDQASANAAQSEKPDSA